MQKIEFLFQRIEGWLYECGLWKTKMLDKGCIELYFERHGLALH